MIREFVGRAFNEDPELYAMWLIWEVDEAPVLIGPFYSGRALLAAIRVRTRALRQKYRGPSR